MAGPRHQPHLTADRIPVRGRKPRSTLPSWQWPRRAGADVPAGLRLGLSTHAFRAANANDEPPENHYHTWRYPALVGWNGYPAGIRDKLSQADFGSAVFGLKDGNVNAHLAKAKPAGIPFDPNA